MELPLPPQETFPPADQPQIVLTDEARYYLQKAGQWAYFLGIMGFIGTAFIAIMALFAGTLFTTMARANPLMEGMAAGLGTLMTVIYLLLAVFSFFFALYLYQFGDKIKNAVAYNNTAEATLAFSKLKSFFKLWGITTIVYLSFTALVLVGSIVVGIGAASMMSR
ncbi:DUF5362 family protein [Mucilaginibacter psychrotolerans]|uniref:DUF5362 domain-containing protein n=1 Tax=Mucilaginibacter psychrotolerans TaxID=1524096 RepID=A0A4Y8S9X7_9SPHI|nr:DUF5362 family protein [Mucilaginibacter psychrotolerans]TFF35903.1 hypothetical protein E2R66_16940 [Mucilaginibacter psychrotolerans]